MIYTLTVIDEVTRDSTSHTSFDLDSHRRAISITNNQVDKQNREVTHEQTVTAVGHTVTTIIVGQGLNEKCHLCGALTTEHMRISSPFSHTVPTCERCQPYVVGGERV